MSGIPYIEYRTIWNLVQAHIEEYEGRLRAAVAFGPLVSAGFPNDIELLEVVDDWEGPMLQSFTGSAALPLRTQLRLYILPSEEFQHPESITDPEERRWVEELVNQVAEEHELIWENPVLFARRVLTLQRGTSTLNTPPSGSVIGGDPLRPALRHS
jgi:hypothetical protein